MLLNKIDNLVQDLEIIRYLISVNFLGRLTEKGPNFFSNDWKARIFSLNNQKLTETIFRWPIIITDWTHNYRTGPALIFAAFLRRMHSECLSKFGVMRLWFIATRLERILKQIKVLETYNHYVAKSPKMC